VSVARPRNETGSKANLYVNGIFVHEIVYSSVIGVMGVIMGVMGVMGMDEFCSFSWDVVLCFLRVGGCGVGV